MAGVDSGRSSRQSVSRASVLGLAAFAGLGQDRARETGRGDSPHSRSGRASVAATRQSGRYSQASVHRGSRAPSVVRGSVRFGKGGPDSQGLPYERVVCVDEDGRDRTPKPLVSAPRHAGRGGLPVGPDGTLLGGGWGGDALGPLAGLAALGGGGSSDSTSERSSIISFGQLPNGGSFSARSFLTNDPTEPSREPSLDGLPTGRAAREASVAYAYGGVGGGGAPNALGGGGGGDGAEPAAAAEPLTAAIPDASRADAQQRQQQQAQQQHRSRTKGTQCPRAARATRGVQAHPWELCGAADAEAEPLTHRSQGEAGGEGGGAVGDEEEALLALRSPGRGGGGGRAGDDWHGSVSSASQRGGQLSQSTSRRESFSGGSASRRGSFMGYGRASMMHGDDDGRPDTSAGSRRTSIQTGEWSARNSISIGSRASFAAFARAEGRSSVMAGPLGSGGQPRGSVMQRQGGGGTQSAAVPQPTAEELAAAAARRQKAEQERALARMPGLLRRLQAAERAVLLNVRHAQLAQYHGVQLCSAEPRAAEPSSGFASAAPTARTSRAQLSSRPATRRVPASLPLLGEPAGGEASALVLEGMAAGAAAAALAVAEGAETPSAFMSSAASSPMHTSRQPIPDLPLLWSWRSELSGELPVSCLAFNPAAPGLLAVGYGRLEYAAAGAGGLLAVWSLTNPGHPVWHAVTPCGVSALDWSGKVPGQLAAGFFDGSVALYDVRATSSGGGSGGGGGMPQPLARAPPAGGAPSAGGGHAEPVWRLRHVPKASDPGEEMLVSVSSDGRLLEWKHAQGLERAELLRLKRQQSAAARRVRQQAAAKAGGGAGAEGYLGRSAGGTCFDFCPADPRTYLVGTEDGGVHRCSTAFTEQSLGSYGRHLGPVYQVCWSPFSPSHFLTASADWSVRLWSAGQPHSLWTFQLAHSRAEVADVAFCPAASTLFAAAAGNSLQLWDVERSVLVPRALGTRLGVRLTALAFSRADPVVVVGADDGVVSVYSLAGFGLPAAGGEGGEPLGEQEQRQRFEAALRHHTAGAIAED